MRSQRRIPLVISVLGTAIWLCSPHAVHAQKTEFKPAAKDYVLKHGDLVSITQAGVKVTGTFVREDKKKGMLLVRESANELPTGVARNNIKQIELGWQIAKQPGPKGKPPVLVPQAVNEPEIHRMEGYNGATRTVNYFAANLTAAERAVVVELEEAENELGRLELLAHQRDDFLQNAVSGELALQNERLNTHQLLNRLLVERPRDVPYPPISIFHLRFDQAPNQGAFLESYKEATPQNLSKARAALRAAQVRAIYADGQVIAVTQ